MQRVFLLILFLATSFHVFGQALVKDSLIIVQKNPEKGFYSDYLLFIPKGTLLKSSTTLLIEPNNTGRTSDSIEIHKQYAIDLASVSSVGNNIATMLKIPLLVPVFPRPSNQPLLYSHALDRDVMLEKSPEYTRLDLQLLKMFEDAKVQLKTLNINLQDQFFMSGFSASATFVNRFSFLHPEKIKALAIGGFNGELMLPQNKIENQALDYPLGTHDFTSLFQKKN